MDEPKIKTVAIVGTGVVGRGWIRVFSRAGCRTKVYDRDQAQLEKNIQWVKQSLDQDVVDGFVSAKDAQRQIEMISVHTELASTLSDAMYIQENTPEKLEVKQAVFAEIDRLADPSAIIATSSSGLDINQIAAGLSGMSRCILAHPYNPPHVTPVVEVLPTKSTPQETTMRTMAFLQSIGQVPVLMNFYIKGFLGNRIQSAVVREAIHLVESGVASVAAVDAVLSYGLGLRWALLGNFGVNTTNADGGIEEYYNRFGNAFIEQMNDLDSKSPAFDTPMIKKIGDGVKEMYGDTPVHEICQWRDRLVRKILQLKREDPCPDALK